MFSLQNLEAFLLIFAIFFANFLDFAFSFDLLLRLRIIKVAESNQAKASLRKRWLATKEANRLPVVCGQFARR